MSVRLRPVVGLLLWGAATAAILKLSDLPGEFEHAFCGPWG
jgi:hypothetical protein